MYKWRCSTRTWLNKFTACVSFPIWNKDKHEKKLFSMKTHNNSQNNSGIFLNKIPNIHAVIKKKVTSN